MMSGLSHFLLLCKNDNSRLFVSERSARLFHVMETTTPAYYFVNGCASGYVLTTMTAIPTPIRISNQLPHSNGNTHINIKVEKPCIENGDVWVDATTNSITPQKLQVGIMKF